MASRPAEFNPSRYVSYCVHEHVGIDRPMDHDQFSRLVRRWVKGRNWSLFYDLYLSIY